MCGRYAASAGEDELVETFEIDEVRELPAPRFNMAPTEPIPAVVERTNKDTGEVARLLVAPRWGLVPSWSKGPAGGAKMINARFETVADKPAFRRAFATRRCLLPADGYYEWYATDPTTPGGKPGKQPFYIHPGDGGLLVMAGIYEFWKDPAVEGPDAWLTTAAIITTSATDALGHIHDRMPMIIGRNAWDAWLDPHHTDPASALALLSVPASDGLEAYAVSKLVNSVTNDGPELVLPLGETP